MLSKDDISCFTNISSTSPQGNLNMYTNINNDHSSSLLYNLSILKEKFHHLQSLVTVLTSPDVHHQIQNHQESSNTTPNIMSMSNITTLVQEVIVTASSMMFTCQQMSITDNTTCDDPIDVTTIEDNGGGGGQGSFPCDAQNLDWYGDNLFSSNTNTSNLPSISIYSNNTEKKQSISRKTILMNNCDIIEMDASDLLAKYTHYCQICGKGFKRDANLRMHMRAHGDQYKSTAALSKKSNAQEDELSSKLPRKYSCPQEGCRWNSKHAKFQPLKSMICAKNHYKRSHCPKMYMCKRCSQKQFSVLSDLRTHEKHCGDLKWLCSCGTTFSRKDKLTGHVALFAGHSPAIISSSTVMHM